MSMDKALDGLSIVRNMLCIFSTVYVSHQCPELSGWVKRWKGRSRPYRNESPCQQARSWLLRYGHSLLTSWLLPLRPHRWYRHRPWRRDKNSFLTFCVLSTFIQNKYNIKKKPTQHTQSTWHCMMTKRGVILNMGITGVQLWLWSQSPVIITFYSWGNQLEALV